MKIQHEEFPELTDQALAVLRTVLTIDDPSRNTRVRQHLAAFLREAMIQAGTWGDLKAMVNNLHSLPPAPTLDQAWAANLQTEEGQNTVRAFLVSLRETKQQ